MIDILHHDIAASLIWKRRAQVLSSSSKSAVQTSSDISAIFSNDT